MRLLLAELNRPITTRSRALWSWFLAPVAFCIGAFAHGFGLSGEAMLVLLAVLWTVIVIWVAVAPKKSSNFVVWCLASVAGMVVTMTSMIGLTLWLS